MLQAVYQSPDNVLLVSDIGVFEALNVSDVILTNSVIILLSLKTYHTSKFSRSSSNSSKSSSSKRSSSIGPVSSTPPIAPATGTPFNITSLASSSEDRKFLEVII